MLPTTKLDFVMHALTIGWKRTACRQQVRRQPGSLWSQLLLRLARGAQASQLRRWTTICGGSVPLAHAVRCSQSCAALQTLALPRPECGQLAAALVRWRSSRRDARRRTASAPSA